MKIIIYFYFLLFLTTFLAATLIPLSSEAILSSALLLKHNPVLVLIVASLGNCGGVTLNYFLGKKGVNFFLRRKAILTQEKLDYFNRKFNKYNNALFLLAWLPVIGDPITIYAGIIELRFQKFILYVFTGRIVRYIATYFITMEIVSIVNL